MKARIALQVVLVFCCLNSGAQDIERLPAQPTRKFEITMVDRTIKALFDRWAKQDGRKLDWKFKYTDVSLLEVSLGSKRPEEYTYLLNDVKSVKDAIDAILSQQLTLNSGQTIEAIFEPNTIKACIAENVITILGTTQKCPVIEQDVSN